MGGTVGYRRELAGQRARAVALGATSATGSVVGAALLLVSSQALFERIVPFLVFLACGLLTVLGILLTDSLQRLNALKGLLSLLVAVVAAITFALFAEVSWVAVAVMAAAACSAASSGSSSPAPQRPGPALAGDRLRRRGRAAPADRQFVNGRIDAYGGRLLPLCCRCHQHCSATRVSGSWPRTGQNRRIRPAFARASPPIVRLDEEQL